MDGLLTTQGSFDDGDDSEDDSEDGGDRAAARTAVEDEEDVRSAHELAMPPADI